MNRWQLAPVRETRRSTWRVSSMEGKNERVKIPPRKTRHVRFGGYGKLYLTMFLCVLWDLSVFLSNYSWRICQLSCVPVDLFQEDLPECVFPEGPVTCIVSTRQENIGP
ncbi:hypothetical protein Bbelb_076200 [Branchiostoma belcheri]|nr:hypothetical protein Bbelb_076200 [Branchiostoma belcheri]